MKPSEFTFYAAKLASRANLTRAEYRSAISRAYYGVFHSVKEFVEKDLGHSCKAGGSEHRKLQQFLMNCRVDEGVDLGRMLQNLHESRREADYDLDDVASESQSQARLCVERAVATVSALTICASGSLKENIRAGIEAYRKLTNT